MWLLRALLYTMLALPGLLVVGWAVQRMLAEAPGLFALSLLTGIALYLPLRAFWMKGKGLG